MKAMKAKHVYNYEMFRSAAGLVLDLIMKM